MLFSVRSRAKSFLHAFRGIRILIRKEANARIHLAAVTLVIVLGVVFPLSATEWCLLLLTCGLVLGLEALNAAIERLADHVSEEEHERIARVKDLSAGAVLIASIFATALAALIFLPHLLQ